MKLMMILKKLELYLSIIKNSENYVITLAKLIVRRFIVYNIYNQEIK